METLKALFGLSVVLGLWWLCSSHGDQAVANNCGGDTQNDASSTDGESEEDFLARQRFDNFEHHLHDHGTDYVDQNCD